jgi:hypothetical protein
LPISSRVIKAFSRMNALWGKPLTINIPSTACREMSGFPACGLQGLRRVSSSGCIGPAALIIRALIMLFV